MSKMTPQEMASRIGGGLLSFPVTPFKSDLSFDEAAYRSNMDWLCGYDVAGLFAAGGTGEFFSLTPAEVPQVVAVAVSETKGRVPVLAGTGYGTAIAREIAIGAEKAGADGLLLLPPYLTHSEQDGLAAHVEAVCAAVKIGVIVYNRDNAILQPDTLARLCDRCPNLIGYKDGIGDIELMQRVYTKMGDRADLCRRPADGGNLRAALSRHGRHDLFVGRVQLRARICHQFLRSGPPQGSPGDPCRAEGFHPAADRDPQSQEGLCCLDHQGRYEGDRPRFRSGATTADRPD